MAESTFISAAATPGNTSRTDVYTCPSNFKGIVRFINVGNVDASGKTAMLESVSYTHLTLPTKA